VQRQPKQRTGKFAAYYTGRTWRGKRPGQGISFSKLVSEALTKACHPFQRLWAQHLPPFLPCRIHRRYEIKGLAWPGRERDYDSKSQEEFNE
jgi:hypothetical protein